MILDHTEANEDYRGQKVGKRVLMEVVRFAEKRSTIKSLDILPHPIRGPSTVSYLVNVIITYH